jgi:uncharacterized protein (TIGR02147 family)
MGERKIETQQTTPSESPEKRSPSRTPLNVQPLSIWGYTNYRGYLRDHYHFRKETLKSWSYRSFSKAAGFASPNVLKLVIEGERNIGPATVAQFIRGLGLKGPMAEYFEALVHMNQAKDDAEREKHLQKMTRLTPHANRRNLGIENLKYLSHWLHPVIRELVSLKEFHPDPYWISRRLRTTVAIKDITDAWTFLVEEGFVRKNAAGRYETADQMITSPDEISSLAIRNFHRQMLEQAHDALDSVAVTEREFGALVLKVPQGAMDALKVKLKTFRKELHEWALHAANESSGQEQQDHSAEHVIQVNIQMYPHTRKVGG